MSRWIRTARTAFWLGWQIESNWTEPFLFLVYAVARPLGGALILVFMVHVVTRAGAGPVLWYLVVGSAFWPFVLNGLQGTAWAVISDREHWRTLKYIYTAPIPYQAYLVGRALAQMVAASAAMAVTLGLGVVALGLPLSLGAIAWTPLALAMLAGTISTVVIGLTLVALALSISGDAWRMPEGVAAALYLISGVIFPVTVLPHALGLVAQSIPLSWWLESLRRSVVPGVLPQSFPGLSDGEVLLRLLATSAIWLVVGLVVFRAGLHRALQLGILDRESAY